jgi:hypothetical protein
MRCTMGFCFVLAVTSVALANETTQQPAPPPPGVRSSVPNIQAPGEAAVTTPSTTVQQGTATAPTTTISGNPVAAQGVATPAVPSGNTTYYYPGTMYRTAVPGTYYYYSRSSTPVYTTPTQSYYTMVRRGFPFGLFRRRFVQPMAYTPTTAMNPTYYTGRSYYYTPTTYTYPVMTAPAGTFTSGVISPGTAAPVYTPTTYTTPNEALPSGSTTSAGTTTPADATAPTGGNSSSGRVPSRSVPPPPPVNPR